ncbi:hypothetical protein [Vogesella alkaliphila]|uniref:Uncharacterized protein n=1 Tax=Vogesella alkaliphila TaxID=1193621 RepID=A0ABQ2YNP4_9NEIS|nr:hypothetical protein [Vogesella alkaliphila]GGX88715.1 hypothetical protein GCM10011290_15510 [Vogesella alkaliphila]
MTLTIGADSMVLHGVVAAGFGVMVAAFGETVAAWACAAHIIMQQVAIAIAPRFRRGKRASTGFFFIMTLLPNELGWMSDS